MSRTVDSFIPLQFLASLRQSFPQFAEVSGGGGANKILAAYAQQGSLYHQGSLLGDSEPFSRRRGMLLSDNWECSSRRSGAIRKKIHRGLHDVPGAERVGVNVCGK